MNRLGPRIVFNDACFFQFREMDVVKCDVDALSMFVVRGFSSSNVFGNLVYERAHLHCLLIGVIQ